VQNGDLVRFKKLAVITARGGVFGFDESSQWVIGLLVEYHVWEKIATILYEGKVYRIRASDVQKAGKKDGI
jgi:hypothetical protein